MTENVPPAPNNAGGTAANGAMDQTQNRGIPYYEKLRRDLRDALQKKRLMDKSMSQLEDQIYRFEQSYLEETSAGNIIKGFDNYIKGSAGGSNLASGGLAFMGGGTTAATRRKAQVLDQDRVFSRSSACFMRDSPPPSSAQTTPSQAPTPTSSFHGMASNHNGNNKSGEGSGSASGSVKGSNSSTSKHNKKKSIGGVGRDGGNREKDDDIDGTEGAGDASKPQKRLKISYAREQ